MRDDIHNGIAGMTAAQSQGLRRTRKLRALRLLSAGSSADSGRTALDDESLERVRQAMREWGGLTPIPLPARGRR